jgi:hypothetical protein
MNGQNGSFEEKINIEIKKITIEIGIISYKRI